jgi:hypothetical protein
MSPVHLPNVAGDMTVFCSYGEAVSLEGGGGVQFLAHGITPEARALPVEGICVVDVRARVGARDTDIAEQTAFGEVRESAACPSPADRRPLWRLGVHENDDVAVFGEAAVGPGRTPGLVPRWSRRSDVASAKAQAGHLGADTPVGAGDRSGRIHPNNEQGSVATVRG